ncbi:DNA methylase [Sulfitobacter brevis]|uniref:site-specific DNA-methyltransferase (adenine-specific) n=2 Tax=Sulfitobacter brevis TaxID=74348 RepID=A0A1I2C6T0_9RHOB|nr:DNA methylase [Sulfitobacter brevis]
MTTLDFFAGSGTTAHAVIELNRKDHGKRKYVLIEQGKYFETVLKPRVMKVVYSKGWREAKPIAPETGISHLFKILKIESYEDVLNNLIFERTDDQENFLNGFKKEAKDNYLMRYMLDVESKNSLLSIDDFLKPFDYALKIAVDSAGAFKTRKVDLIETFSYLIGLRVGAVDLKMDKGYAHVTGTLPSGERTMVVWRDCEVIGYNDLPALFDGLGLVPGQKDYDLIYVNGDHNVPDILVTKENGEDVTERMTLRRIEPVFLDAMFNVDDV